MIKSIRKIIMSLILSLFMFFTAMISISSNKDQVYADSNTTETYWKRKSINLGNDSSYASFDFYVMYGGNKIECDYLQACDGIITATKKFPATGDITLYDTYWNADYGEILTATSSLDASAISFLKTLADQVFPVTYDLNGGTGTAPTTNKKYASGDKIDLDDGSGLSKTDCTFGGWSTTSTSTTGNTGKYTIKDSDIKNNSITFYAVWVEKETPTISNLAPVSDLSYTGQPKELVTAGTSNGGTIKYALGNKNAPTSSYSTTIPTATDIGTYYVWYTTESTDTHKALTPSYIEVSIYHSHGIKGNDGYIEFNKTLDSNFKGGTLESGNYLLTGNISLENNVEIKVDSTVNICLNGYVFNFNGDHQVFNYGSLGFYDCNTTTVHKFSIDSTNNFATLDDNGSYEVKGGIITGFSSTDFRGMFSTIHYSGDEINYTDIIDFKPLNNNLAFDNVTIIGNKSNITTTYKSGNEVLYGLIVAKTLKLKDTEVSHNYISQDFKREGNANNLNVVFHGDLFTAKEAEFIHSSIIKNYFNYGEKLRLSSYGVVCYVTTTDGLTIKNSNISYNKVVINGDKKLFGLLYSVGDIDSSDSAYNENSLKGYIFEGSIMYGKGNISSQSDQINKNKIEAKQSINGGLICGSDNTYKITLKNTNFKYNNIKNEMNLTGGLIFGYNFEIYNVNVSENEIYSEALTAEVFKGSIFFAKGSFTSEELTINNNTITSINTESDLDKKTNSNFRIVEGGFIYVFGECSCTSDYITENTYTTNKAIGGIYYFGNNATLNDVLIEENEINVNKYNTNNLIGGLIYAGRTEGFNPIGTTTIKGNSIIDYNTINSSTTVNGGLIYGDNVVLDDIGMSNNQVTISVTPPSNSSSDSKGGLFGAQETLVTNSIVVSENNVTCACTVDSINSSIIGGLVYASKSYLSTKDTFTSNTIIGSVVDGGIASGDKVAVFDKVLVESNTIKSTRIAQNNNFAIRGGIFSFTYTDIGSLTIKNESKIDSNSITSTLSSTGGLFYVNGEILFDGVGVYQNTFNSSNSNENIYYSLKGGLVYAEKLVSIKNSKIYKNSITGENYSEIYGGLIYLNKSDASFEYNTVEIYENHIDVGFTSKNDDKADSIIGALIYDSLIVSDSKSSAKLFKEVKIYDNLVEGDFENFNGLLKIIGGDFENVEIYNNNSVSDEILYNECTLGAVILNKDGISINGKVIINNNKINEVQYNLCIDDPDFDIKVIIKEDAVIDDNSKIHFTYMNFNDSKKAVIVDGGSNLFDKNIFDVDNPRYYVSNDSENNKIYMNGRIDEQPTSSNLYEFKLNETRYNGTFNYQWYRIVNSQNNLLENNTSDKLDLTSIVFGNYICKVTLKDGDSENGVISSNTTPITPKIIENPDENNNYTYIVDDSRCEENDVSITYKWYKSEENEYQLNLFTNENTESMTSQEIEEYCEMIIDETSTYNDSTGTWSISSNNIFAKKISLNAGDILIISSDAFDCDCFQLVILYNNVGEHDKYEDALVLEDCTSAYYEVKESGDYYILSMATNEQEELIEFNISLGLIDEFGSMDESKLTLTIDDEVLDNIITYLESIDMGADKDLFNDLIKSANGYTFSLITAFYAELEAYQYISLKSLDDQKPLYGLVYLSEDFTNAGFIFGSTPTFGTLVGGNYYFVTIYMDGEVEVSINSIGGTTFTEVEGLTSNKLSADNDDTYVCVATYDDGVEVINVSSRSVNYEFNKDVISNTVITKKTTDSSSDSEDSTKVEIIEGGITRNIVVVISKEDEQVSKTVSNNIKNTVSKNSELVAKFDIHLEDQNGVKVENIDGNKYRVTLTIPEQLLNRTGFAIVYIDDNGNVEKYISNVDSSNNTIVFETTHFSTWAIVADSNTNVGGVILLILGILVLLFIGLFIAWKIEYDKANKNNTLENRILKFLDIVFLPINNLLFNKK